MAGDKVRDIKSFSKRCTICIYALILLAMLIISCSKKNENRLILIFDNYNGDSEMLYREIGSITAKIAIQLMDKLKIPIPPLSLSINPDEIASDKRYTKNIPSLHYIKCDSFKDDAYLTQGVEYAQKAHATMLIYATPKPIDQKNRYEITYSVLDFRKGCQVYQCKATYRTDLKVFSTDYKAIRAIANELSQVIEKSE